MRVSVQLALPPAAAPYRASGFVLWPIATQIDVGSDVGYRGRSRIVTNGPNPTLLTPSRLWRLPIIALREVHSPLMLPLTIGRCSTAAGLNSWQQHVKNRSMIEAG
jgi:hypothetical protein